MKTLSHLFFSIILIITCSQCTKNEDKSFTVINHYSRYKLHHTDSTTLTIRKNDSTVQHLFGIKEHPDGEEEIMEPYFEVNKNDLSVIWVNDEVAKFVAAKEYLHDSETITIRKYFYQPEGAIDDWAYCFTYNQDRIVAFKSTAWNICRFYEYEDLKISEMLRSDTTEFFDFFNQHPSSKY